MDFNKIFYKSVILTIASFLGYYFFDWLGLPIMAQANILYLFVLAMGYVIIFAFTIVLIELFWKDLND